MLFRSKKTKAVTKVDGATIKNVMGRKLRELRTSQHMTQKDLEEILDYPDSTVNKWELGKRYIPYEILFQLNEIFDVDFNFWGGNNKYEVIDKEINKLIFNCLKAINEEINKLIVNCLRVRNE